MSETELLIAKWRAEADVMDKEANRTWDDDAKIRVHTIRRLADELAALATPAAPSLAVGEQKVVNPSEVPVAHFCKGRWKPYPSLLCSSCKEVNHNNITLRGLTQLINRQAESAPTPTTSDREELSQVRNPPRPTRYQVCPIEEAAPLIDSIAEALAEKGK